MAQTGTLGSRGEPLLNIFPNPCKGDTFLYTDDLEAAWVAILDSSGAILQKWPIRAGTSLHIQLMLGYGTYLLVLMDPYENILGTGKSLFISESH